MADPRLSDQLAQIMSRARQCGLRGFLQGGIGPEDWLRQERLQKTYPEIISCFGLHPYWVVDHTSSECDGALDILATKLHLSAGIGEMGLDFRSHFSKDSHERQLDCFEKQIDLAKMCQRPMVLHLVRAFDQAVRVFEMHGVPASGGMVHSFNGASTEAQVYLDLGLHLSVGGPLLRSNSARLRQALQIIPIEKILLETDSPDQPPPSHQDTFNEPSTLLAVADAVAKIKGLSKIEVLNQCTKNLAKLFSLPLKPSVRS